MYKQQVHQLRLQLRLQQRHLRVLPVLQLHQTPVEELVEVISIAEAGYIATPLWAFAEMRPAQLKLIVLVREERPQLQPQPPRPQLHRVQRQLLSPVPEQTGRQSSGQQQVYL